MFIDYDPTDEATAEQERRIDAGDALDPTLGCSFRILDRHTSPPCPQEATARRVVNDVEVPACSFHNESGGVLNTEALRTYGRAMVARMNQEAAESALRLGLDPADIGHARFPTNCDNCAAPLFTGNTSGLCWKCNEQTLPYPWKTDRFVYTATTCPDCGGSCWHDGWCPACGRTVIR